MDRKKIILSLMGLAALVVPVVLLAVFTGNSAKQPATSSEQRTIDPQTVKSVVNKFPSPEPVSVPSPSPATKSATTQPEGSPQAR